MNWLPDPLHPAIVHFPLALAMGAFLMALAARHRRLSTWDSPAVFLLVLAAVGSVAAVLTGDAAHDAAVIPTAAAALVARHEQVGTLAMWVLVGLAAVRLLLAWGRLWRGALAWVFVMLIGASAALVLFNGHLGGQMVYRHGVGTGPVQHSTQPGDRR
jgi:uncharacterized membrane protein